MDASPTCSSVQGGAVTSLLLRTTSGLRGSSGGPRYGSWRGGGTSSARIRARIPHGWRGAVGTASSTSGAEARRPWPMCWVSPCGWPRCRAAPIHGASRGRPLLRGWSRCSPRNPRCTAGSWTAASSSGATYCGAEPLPPSPRRSPPVPVPSGCASCGCGISRSWPKPSAGISTRRSRAWCTSARRALEREQTTSSYGSELPAAATQQHHGDGAEHDLQVFERRLAADVLEVIGDFAAHVVHRGVVPLVHLSPAGDAGPHPLASRVAFDLLAQIHEDVGLFRARPHDVHIADQHVEQLRQLIEPECAQQSADRRDALVLCLRPYLLPVLPGRAHRAELVHRERRRSEEHTSELQSRREL